MSRAYRFIGMLFVIGLGAWLQGAACDAADNAPPSVVAHRGLLLDAPENTLANFAACLHLRVGFEFDVRRSRDGQLVCIHDDTVDRTTNGQGAVSSLSWPQLSALDAGSWFSSDYRGERIPTIDAVLALIAKHPDAAGFYAVDIKTDDTEVEQDLVRLATKHGVLNRLLFIGRTIEHAEVRRRLRAAHPQAHAARVAHDLAELQQAVADRDSDWVYLRFVPELDDLKGAHAAGKPAFIAGATVAGPLAENWRKAALAGVRAILTDHPLLCRQQLAVPRK